MASTVSQGDWDSRQDRVQGELDSLRQKARRPVARRGARVFPSVIISATKDRLVVRAEVPGMDPEGFDISVSGDTLSLQGTRSTGEGLENGWYHRRERDSGSFSRAIRLPAEVDGNQAEATYVAGVLAVSLPLKGVSKPKEIQVRVSKA